MVQNSISSIKRIGYMFIMLKFVSFVFLLLLKTICVKYSVFLFVEFFIPECKFHVPYYIASCDMPPSAEFFTLLRIRQLTEYYDKCNMSCIKCPKFLGDLEGIDFPLQIFETCSNIKFHGFSTRESILLQSERLTWRTKTLNS